MTLIRTTAPTGDVLSASELYAHLRVDLVGVETEPDDALQIAALHAAAVSHLDGPHGILERALLTQEWTLLLDAFPASIPVPLPPLQSVDEITYIDGAGAVQTLSPSIYQVVNKGDDPSEIVPAFGETWPTTRDVPHAVSIAFTCGYGSAASVPAAIKQALRLMAGEWYRHREAVSVETLNALPHGVDALLETYKVGTS